MNLPIVRLEVEHMKQSILHAFTNYSLKLDQQLKIVLDEVCSEDNIRAVLAEAVQKYFSQAIERETKDFFEYGEGREMVKKAVHEKLKKELE